MKNFIIFIFMFSLLGKVYAYDGYEYEKKTSQNHILHILKIDPDYYVPSLVKSNDGNGGRETVSSIAERYKADIAVNAGFFEIGESKDGDPSFSLVIDGKIYKIIDKIQSLLSIKSGKLFIDRFNPSNSNISGISLITGLPMLVKNGEIFPDIIKENEDFYSKSHARTAIGVDYSGKIVIIIAEHYYSRDINDFTMGEFQSLIKEKGAEFAKKYNKNNPGELTLTELKLILKDEISPDDKTKGLSIMELANIMKSLECRDALNLDGGGSSTLWIKGEVVNNAIGDIDEAMGEKVIRPVSDAIIFRKR